MMIDKVAIAANFVALPWRIASENKAGQVAQAVAVVFNTQALGFHGGDGWYVLAENGECLRTGDSAERLDILFSLLEQLDVAPAGDYLVEPLALPHDDAEQEESAIRDIAYRGEYAVNLDRRMDELTFKLDRIIAMIGPVDVRPAMN